MIDTNAVRRTLRAPLTGLDADIFATIRWENVEYDEGADAPPDLYIEEQLVPMVEWPVATKTDRMIGEYRLYVSVPRGSGADRPAEVASYLKNAYSMGEAISGSATVVVTGREVEPGGNVDRTRYVVPVVITFRTDGFR